MNPWRVFCPNIDCPARGQVGKGNIGIHHWQEKRYICHVCGQTFTATITATGNDCQLLFRFRPTRTRR